MARRRYSRKSRKTKKSYRRKNRRAFQNTYVTRAPFARKYCTTLKYAADIQMNPGITGVPAVLDFSLNGIYDPDISGGGHQPKGFDQLMALYDHAIVIGAKWKATFVNMGNAGGALTDGHTSSCGFVITDENPSPYLLSQTWASLAEDPEVKIKDVGPINSGFGKQILHGKINPNKFLGKSKGIMNDDRLFNTVASNPTEMVHLGIFAFPYSVGADVEPVRLHLEIDYKVVFFEPKQLNQS